MTSLYRSTILMVCMVLWLAGCTSGTHENTDKSTSVNVPVSTQANPTEYEEFASKFKAQAPPFALPGTDDKDSSHELDKKYINDLLNVDFTSAFGSEDILPGLADNMDAAKYYTCGKVSLDSFSGYIIHKQGDDDYYFLCLFDKQGKFTDGMCIAFKEGTDDDGTMREASVNEDGSIEISQYNLVKGRPDRAGANRHFYEITNEGKIRDLKNDAAPSHA